VAEASAGGEVAWRDRSTYLHRESGGKGKRKGGRATEPPRAQAEWRVPGDTGRRYAAVSGDRNPIHLHGVPAKLLGQKGAIAHGMWSKARCLAALESQLPDAYAVEVAFKLPILLPAEVAFATWTDDAERRFALHDARSGKPHLEGGITPAAAAA
jgi:acyl dehydratase